MGAFARRLARLDGLAALHGSHGPRYRPWVREHRFTIDLPHPRERLWALFQRYDLWKEYAPAVLDVEVVHPGDDHGNGLLRKVIYPLPLGRRGESYELLTNVRENEGYDYLMLGSGLSGSLQLERTPENNTRLAFRERFHIRNPLLRPFEGAIYRFINKKNEASIIGASRWLDAHPDFRPDLAG
jgi:hypothetical protein